MAMVNIVDPSGMQSLLFKLSNANMQSTADQKFSRLFDGTTYAVTSIFARQRSGSTSVTCLGGIYDSPSKGGSAIVTSLQTWIPLASGLLITVTLAALTGTNVLTDTPYLSLTTGSLTSCLADIYIFGVDLS